MQKKEGVALVTASAYYIASTSFSIQGACIRTFPCALPPCHSALTSGGDAYGTRSRGPFRFSPSLTRCFPDIYDVMKKRPSLLGLFFDLSRSLLYHCRTPSRHLVSMPSCTPAFSSSWHTSLSPPLQSCVAFFFRCTSKETHSWVPVRENSLSEQNSNS